MDEILGINSWENLPIDHQSNLFALHHSANILRAAFGKPMVITSGYRSWAVHENIYKKLGRTPPKGSMHLRGAAIDIHDPEKDLKIFLLENVEILEQANLWCEGFDYTPNWVHLQCLPPSSGNRFYQPY
jgi:hypothetical protein